MPHHPHRSLPYRPALDGLRGIAVAAVVIYHVWPNALPGGWLGVDLFFVLSGFLITTLLTTEWARWGSISLLGFWTARARRLLPSLVTMLLTVIVAAYFWTLPSRRIAVGWDVLSALFYVANWRMYISNEAYFATDVGLPSPVRHTWSLAIEEQYYLLYPLLLLVLLVAVRRVARRWRTHLLAGVILLLAAVSAWRMQTLYIPGADPSRVYYGTDTRVFELLIGSAAGVWLGAKEFNGRSRRTFDTVAGRLAWPALAVLVIAFAVLHDDVSALFPWGLVLLSAVAVVPIIAATARRRSVVATGLAWEPLRGLGLISYSLYLWHWPVVVFLGPQRLPLQGFALGIAQIAISVLLAYGSFRFIERPIRRGGLRALLPSTPTAGRLVGVLAVPALVIGTVVVTQSASATGSAQASANGSTSGSTLRYTARGYTPLPGAHGVTLIGNSIPASVERSFPPSSYPDLNVQADVNFGCDPFEGAVVTDGRAQPTPAGCGDFRRNWPALISSSKPSVAAFFVPQTMVMDHSIDGRTIRFNTPAYTSFVRSALDSVRTTALSHGARQFAVVTLACHDVPFANINPQARMMNDDSRVVHTNTDVRAWARERQVPVIDQYGFLCTGGYHANINSTALYEDGLHFSSASGASFWSWLAPQFQQILRRQ